MATQMKLANECVDCLTAFMRDRLERDVSGNCGSAPRVAALHKGRDKPECALPKGHGRSAYASEAQPQPMLDAVNSLLASRKARLKFFDSDLFFDPTWAILLDLYQSEMLGKQVSVTSICLGSGVPSTTALRYLRILEERGYIARVSDEQDKRRSFVTLTDRAREAMVSYLQAL